MNDVDRISVGVSYKESIDKMNSLFLELYHEVFRAEGVSSGSDFVMDSKWFKDFLKRHRKEDFSGYEFMQEDGFEWQQFQEDLLDLYYQPPKPLNIPVPHCVTQVKDRVVGILVLLGVCDY